MKQTRESTRDGGGHERETEQEGGEGWRAHERPSSQVSPLPLLWSPHPIPYLAERPPRQLTCAPLSRGCRVQGRLRTRGYSGYRGFRANTACLQVGVYPYPLRVRCTRVGVGCSKSRPRGSPW